MDMITIDANGKSSNGSLIRDCTFIRTETVSPEGIIVIRYELVKD
jgi:hypothetical protein